MGPLGERLVQLFCRAGWKEGEKDPEKQISWQFQRILFKSSSSFIFVGMRTAKKRFPRMEGEPRVSFLWM